MKEVEEILTGKAPFPFSETEDLSSSNKPTHNKKVATQVDDSPKQQAGNKQATVAGANVVAVNNGENKSFKANKMLISANSDSSKRKWSCVPNQTWLLKDSLSLPLFYNSFQKGHLCQKAYQNCQQQ